MDFTRVIASFSSFSLYVLLFAAILFFVLYYLVYSRRVVQWKKSNIPFLQPSFLIGHKYFLNLTKNSWLVSIDRIYRQNSDKDVVGFFLGTIPLVLVRKPALIKKIFVKNFDKTFESALSPSKHDRVAQNTLNFCTDKSLWQSSRNTLSPMFASYQLSGDAFGKVSRHISRMMAHIEDTFLSRTPINIREVSQKFDFDCRSSIFLGLDSNSYEKEGVLVKMNKEMTTPSLANMLKMYAQIQFPGSEMPDSFKSIGKKAIGKMTDIISKQVQSRSQNGSEEHDFMDLLMTLKENDEKVGKANKEMDITDQMIGFGLTTLLGTILGGIDGLAMFAIHLLSLYPEHQDRIRKEVVEVMEKHKTSELTYDVVRDLQFTEQCLYETTRLYPVVPAIIRICSEDFGVSGTDYTFKKGERIMIDPYSLHRDPSYFEKPDEFDPERFSPENRGKCISESFFGFGVGPRKCPGYRMGMLMATALIASIVHKYQVKPNSHFERMEVTDFNPSTFLNIPKHDVLVNVVAPEILAQ